MTEAASRFSLRDLPLPAKLVVTCFLLAVGGGYTAAMVQLHMQDAKSGSAMPTPNDVILKYTGKKWFETEPPQPRSHFVKLLVTPAGAPFNGSGSMLPAFTTRDGGEFMKAVRGAETMRERLQPERDGERDALVLWAESSPDVRKKAYDDDHFGIKADKEPRKITPDFKIDGAYKVKSIIETRCVRCHKPGSDEPNAANYPLQNYSQIEKYLTVPANAPFRAGGDWVRVQEPIGMEKLTQSTHAHLLSFSMLFSLTGLVFAFTSYPVVLRCILGPWVLLAMVADISLWWLSRLCDQWGPSFAMGIIGTGAFAGVGLMLQIGLSLLNIYGPKGKLVVLLLFLLAGAGAWQVYVNKVKPGLEEKQQRIAATKPDIEKKEPDVKDPVNSGNAGGKVARMLTLPAGAKVSDLKWTSEVQGGMVRAFFDKDSAEFAAAVKEKDDTTQAKLTPDRHGEREALLSWLKLADAERRKAFEADAFPLPSDWGKKPISADYVKNGKVKVQSIVTDRCVSCHADHEKVPFKDYETLANYLK